MGGADVKYSFAYLILPSTPTFMDIDPTLWPERKFPAAGPRMSPRSAPNRVF
jgi:hypothetical protein